MKQISEQFRKLHEYGDVIANFMLGYLYQKGEILPKDLDKAYEFYNKAASINIIIDDPLVMQYKISARCNALIFQFVRHNESEEEQENIKAEIMRELGTAEKYGDADLLYYLGYMYEDGIFVQQDKHQAFKLYNLAHNRQYGHIDATFRLGILYKYGRGCNKDEEKANSLFMRAQELGNSSAKLSLHKDWLSIWPNESWLNKNIIGDVGTVFGTKYGMDLLQTAINEYEYNTTVNKSFSIEKNLTSDIEFNIKFWLQMLSYYGVEPGTYTVAKYALGKLNEFAIENESYLSPWRLSIPFYIRNSESVDTYVKLYAWSQAWLNRAQKAGVKIDLELQKLKQHQGKVENTCSTVYDKYKKNAAKDEHLWKRATALIKSDQEYKEQESIFSTLPASCDIRTQLKKMIIHSNVKEYNIWSLCILDKKELNILHRDFFNQAIKSKRFKEAREFINSNEFDVNYIIPELDKTPIEFILDQEWDNEAKALLTRGNVDINSYGRTFSPIFTAIKKGNVASVELFLSKDEIDLNTKYEIEGEFFSPIEVATIYNQKTIAQMINDRMQEK